MPPPCPSRERRATQGRFGNRTGLSLTEGAGSPLAYGWTDDTKERLETATLPGAAQSLAFGYYDNDDLETLTHGNGLATNLAYYPHGPIQSIDVPGATPSHGLAYTPDATGSITQITESLGLSALSPNYVFA
jgi:hypothetical protein